MTYAANTPVPVEKTRAEIEKLVCAKGAAQFMSATDVEHGRCIVGWRHLGRMVRLEVPLPEPSEKRFIYPRGPNGFLTYKRHAPERTRLLWEQACRTRWRAMLLIVKAKFEAIDAGITTFEREFLADTLMANGSTVGQWMQPQLEEMYATGKMPALLPGLGETSR